MDSVASAELLTACSSRRDRRIVDRLLAPFESAGRVVSPNYRDFHRAGEALSKLRATGQTLKNPGGALLNALQAADAIRIGALLVTDNISDFRKLARYMPVSIQSFDEFKRLL